MVWLDGGHNGNADTWITDVDVVKNFADFYGDVKDFRVSVHVTPYQMNDARRPHIGRQKTTFCQLVGEAGMSLEDRTHFVDQKRTIELHFDVLTQF